MVRADNRSGFTLIELLIVVALIGILAAIVAPYLLQAKRVANEASAIGTLKAVNSAQSAYSVSCARTAYANSMNVLVAGAYVGQDANLSPKSGFTFGLGNGLNAVAGLPDCTGAATVSAYYFQGTPFSPMSGQRAFATSEAALVWQNMAGVPPVQPFAVAGTITPLVTH